MASQKAIETFCKYKEDDFKVGKLFREVCACSKKYRIKAC